MWRRTTRSRRLLTLALIAGIAVGLAWSIAHAADGDLDPTFDGDGRVTTNFHDTSDEARAITIQPDGKIVVVGRTHISGTDYNFSVARYNADGSPDTTFGFGDGKLTTGIFTSSNDVASGVAIQPDGKIVVAGAAGVFFSVARYNPDGSPDTTFGGGDGKLATGFSGTSNDVANGVAIQPDGKIVLAGYTTESGSTTNFALVRLNIDGSVDTTFGDDGYLTTDFFGGVDEARAVVIRYDGKIIVAGNAQVSGSNYDFALACYNPDGSPDTTFSDDGKTTVDFFGADDGAYAVALLPADNRIVVAGANFLDCCGYNFGVARFHADGRLDLTFDLDGIQTITFADGTAEEVALGMALQADLKIMVVGYAPVDGINDFALVRLNEDGSLDASFGNNGNGRVTHDFGGGVAIAYAVAIQLDGKIVAVGNAYMGEPNSYDFAVARYKLGDLPTPTSTPTPSTRYMPMVLK